MDEPIFDPTTERVYNMLPGHYQKRDALNGYPLKKYISGLMINQDDVNTLIERFTYTPLDLGGITGDTSDLVDPRTADLAWLAWLGQLFGTQVKGSITEATRQRIISASGFNAGTEESMIAAAQTVLVGSQTARIVRHADESWQPDMTGITNTAGPWDILVMTLESETLKNLLPTTLAQTLSPSVWDANFQSFGYDPNYVWKLLTDQADMYQGRAFGFSLKDPDWKAGATSDTGFGAGGFGQGPFGVGSDLVSTLRLTSHQSFPVTPGDSYQYLVSLGLQQDIADIKRSAIGFKFLDSSSTVIRNATDTNYYPDPSHEYNLAPLTASATNGTLALTTAQKHSGIQSVAFTNTAPLAVVNTNIVSNPDGATSNYYSFGGAPTAAYGAGYSKATWTTAIATSSGLLYNNIPGSKDPNFVLAAGDFVSASAQVLTNVAKSITIYRQCIDSTGADLQTMQTTYPVAANTWTNVSVDGTTAVPAGTSFVRILVYSAAGWNVGDSLETRYLTAVKSPTAVSPFSGATASFGTNTYGWTGAANASPSAQYTPGTGGAGKTMNSLGTAASMGLAVGDLLSISCWVYIPGSVTPGTTVLRLGGTGVTPVNSVVPDINDAWTQLTVTASVISTTGIIQPTIYGGTRTGDVVYFDDFSVMPGDTTTDFNGDTPDPADNSVQYSWSGTPGASPSIATTDAFTTPITITPTVINTAVVSHNFVTSTKANKYTAYSDNPDALSVSNYGTYNAGDVIRAQVTNVSTTTQTGLATINLGPIITGTEFTFSLDTFISSDTNANEIRVFFRDDANDDDDAVTFDETTPAVVSLPTKNRWHHRSWTATVNPNRTVTTAYIVVVGISNQPTGAYFDTANWMIEEGNVANQYFNGSSADQTPYRFEWEGLANDSVSDRVLISVAEANVVEMQQFTTRFTAPANAATAQVIIDCDGFNGKDTLVVAQPAVREEYDETWVPETADPIKAIIQHNVKPAGVILHYKPLVSNWDTITAEGTREWQDLELPWTEVEEIGE